MNPNANSHRRPVRFTHEAFMYLIDELDRLSSSRSEFVSHLLLQHRVSIREARRSLRKKFTREELNLIIQAFRECADGFQYDFVSLDDMPRFIELLRQHNSQEAIHIPSLEERLMHRTTQVEFSALFDLILNDRASHIDHVSDAQIEWMAKSFGESVARTLTRFTRRNQIPEFIALLLEGAKYHETYEAQRFSEVEKMLRVHTSSTQLVLIIERIMARASPAAEAG